MRSLLIRIFVSFWSIIVITIIAAASLGYVYAERARATVENFEISSTMLEASASLEQDGRAGLTEWLQSLPGVTASLIYVVDERGQDLLGRRLPPPVVLALRRFGDTRFNRPPPVRDRENLRPARPFTQLIGPSGDVYTLFVLPAQGTVGRWLAQRGGATVIILGLLISAVVSYLLARAMSRPIRRFRESANAIAAGNLDTRVTDRVGKRRDEIGLLAQDFDRMTDELQRAWLKQTELSRNVSHELRSPLARLRVALELARREAGDIPELDRIEIETERLDSLIGQILEFSRLDADISESRSRIDLAELLESIVEDVRFEFDREDDKRQIEMRVDARCSFDGFPAAVRSGIENVLRNAMQHSEGDAAVRVWLGSDSSHAVVAVEDEGDGVPETELDSIFEPFHRSRASQGSGLGLAIAARAIALNGGSISAVNGAAGLKVEIRLPLAE